MSSLRGCFPRHLDLNCNFGIALFTEDVTYPGMACRGCSYSLSRDLPSRSLRNRRHNCFAKFVLLAFWCCGAISLVGVSKEQVSEYARLRHRTRFTARVGNSP